MQWRWLAIRTMGIWAAIAPWTGLGQETQQPAAPASAPTSTEDALHSMSDRAGVIFVGTVASIHRVESDGISSGVVEITFSVEQTVRGTTSGSTYTVREWAGLWMANDQRYRVGQRLLMLLNSPGPGGLSSPVSGLDGAIPVHGTGAAVHPGSTSAAPPSVAVADLRWIAAQVEHPVVYAPPAPLTGVHGTPIRGTARVERATSNTTPAPSTTQQATVPAVLSLIASWSVNHAR